MDFLLCRPEGSSDWYQPTTAVQNLVHQIALKNIDKKYMHLYLSSNQQWLLDEFSTCLAILI